MKTRSKSVLLAALTAFLALVLVPVLTNASETPALSGRVVDMQGQPVQGAHVALFLGNSLEPHAEQETDRVGQFVLDLPDSPVDGARIEVSRLHFEPATWQADQTDLVHLNQGSSIRVPDLALERQITAGFWIATLVFAGMLVLVITEHLHTTAAALLAAAAILTSSLVSQSVDEGLFVISFEQAIGYVDFEVIFLVLGMMIIVGTIERTGIFQWTAYQAYRISRGRLWLLAVILMVLSSVASALLDNVTTMLLVAPITLQIALTLRVNPLALLISEMLASNVGGITTLIGTPNNILRRVGWQPGKLNPVVVLLHQLANSFRLVCPVVVDESAAHRLSKWQPANAESQHCSDGGGSQTPFDL